MWQVFEQGYLVGDLEEVEREGDGYIINSAIGEGELVQVNGLVRLADPEFFARQLAGTGTCLLTHVTLEPGGEHVFFDLPTPSLKVGDVMLAKTDIERIRVGYASVVSPDALAEARTRAATVAPGSKYAAMRISQVVAAFLEAKREGWRPEQQQRMPVMLQLFVDLMDDPRVCDLDRPMVRRYRKELQKLPVDLRKARRDLPPGASGKALVDWAEAKAVDRMKERTADGYVSKLSELLEWAKVEGYVPSNFASGIAENKRRDEKAQDARHIFSDDELTQVFGASWFRTGAGTLAKTGRYANFKPHYFWLPLLGIYTGGRINELSQLYLDDFCLTEAGTHYIHFQVNKKDKLNIDGGDVDPKDKRLKTPNSNRIVPLHSRLVDLGLPQYVGKLRTEGYVRLFPELRFDRVKGYGKAPSSWFNERYLGKQLGIARDGKKTFHSLRHQCLTALDRLDILERTIAQLAGHERGETMAGQRYVKDREADVLKLHIDRLKFPLPPVAPFNLDEGIRAVGDALLRKEQNAKRKASSKASRVISRMRRGKMAHNRRFESDAMSLARRASARALQPER